MLLIGSRLPSEWLSGAAVEMTSADAYVDGSPLDRAVFLLLIAVAAAIVLRRSVSWPYFVATNQAIALFFLFSFVSIGWSEFPLVAFKRWIKVVGHILMVLVVLTDPEPRQAFKALLRRCGYILIPLSVLLIKYYPEIGRSFSQWDGQGYYMGVTTNKNALGNLCLVVGVFFTACLFGTGRRLRAMRIDRWVCCFILCMVGWLLWVANSASSLACTGLGVVVVLGTRVRAIERYFTILLLAAALVVGVLQMVVNVKDSVIEGLGRDTTLTGRTELWDTLKMMEANPLIGAGFESFWLGERAEKLWSIYWWKPNQAHNGYYETYLNLGLIGVALLCGMIVAGYRKSRRHLRRSMHADEPMRTGDQEIAPFRLAFVLAISLFNMTDGTFKAMHLSFFVFFLVAIEYSSVRRQAASKLPGMWRSRRSASREARLRI